MMGLNPLPPSIPVPSRARVCSKQKWQAKRVLQGKLLILQFRCGLKSTFSQHKLSQYSTRVNLRSQFQLLRTMTTWPQRRSELA